MNKYLYPLIVFSNGIHFVLIYFATNASTFELGLYSLINSCTALIFHTTRFDGSYLCISDIISKKQLREWSKSTNTILSFIVIPVISLLFFSEKYLTLSLLLISSLASYSTWQNDLDTINERVKKKSESNYKSKLTYHTLIYRVCLPIILILILNEKIYSEGLIKLVILIELLLIARISLRSIGFNSIFEKFILPPKKYFIPVILGKAEASLFILVLGSILGVNSLGELQLSLSLSRLVKIFTLQFLRVEYERLFSKSFLKLILIINLLLYVIYICIPIICSYLLTFLNQRELFSSIPILIFLFLYYGNENTKLLLVSVNMVIGDVTKNSRDKTILIVLKLLAFIPALPFINISNLSILFAIGIILIPDLIYTINQFLRYFKYTRNTIKEL